MIEKSFSPDQPVGTEGAWSARGLDIDVSLRLRFISIFSND